MPEDPVDRQAVLLPAVRTAARDEDGRLLLVRRRDDDTWCLPGGHLEVGESWEAGALRECQEETGWRVRLTGLLGVYSDPANQIHTFPDGRCVQLVGVVLEGVVTERVSQPTVRALTSASFRRHSCRRCCSRPTGR